MRSLMIVPTQILASEQVSLIAARNGSSAPVETFTRTETIVATSSFCHPNADSSQYYRFAVKSFSASNRALYESEVEVLRALRGNEGMIRCLGDYPYPEIIPFEQNPTDVSKGLLAADKTEMTYNIIFEYRKLDLDEYFEVKKRPQAYEIQELWTGGELQKFRGCHGDIKPDNILVVDNSFKLADLGFARFHKIDQPAALPFGGTRTCGAPEVCNISGNPTTITQAINIWSLGCVFSETVTWTTLGLPGLMEFRDCRQHAVKGVENSAHELPADCFHDGNSLLKEILRWHSYLRNFVERSDTISGLVLDIVEKEMLVSEPQLRIRASALWEKLQDIVKYDNRVLAIDTLSASGRGLQKPEPGSTISVSSHQVSELSAFDGTVASGEISGPNIAADIRSDAQRRAVPSFSKPILARALYDFEPENEKGEETELAFSEGDTLEILEKSGALEEDGWCRARIKDQKKIGLAPMEYLEELGPVEPLRINRPPEREEKVVMRELFSKIDTQIEAWDSNFEFDD